jgi:hypothetical protein
MRVSIEVAVERMLPPFGPAAAGAMTNGDTKGRTARRQERWRAVRFYFSRCTQ